MPEKVLALDEHHVLVISGRSLPPEALAAIAQERQILVIDLGPNGSLDELASLDEDAMREAGWARIAPAT